MEPSLTPPCGIVYPHGITADARVLLYLSFCTRLTVPFDGHQSVPVIVQATSLSDFGRRKSPQRVVWRHCHHSADAGTELSAASRIPVAHRHFDGRLGNPVVRHPAQSDDTTLKPCRLTSRLCARWIAMQSAHPGTDTRCRCRCRLCDIVDAIPELLTPARCRQRTHDGARQLTVP